MRQKMRHVCIDFPWDLCLPAQQSHLPASALSAAGDGMPLASPPGPPPALPIILPRLGCGGLASSDRCSEQTWCYSRPARKPHLGSVGDQKAVSMEHLDTSQIRGFLWGCLGPETAGIRPCPAGEAGFQALSTYHTLFCASASGPASPPSTEPDWLPLCCPTVSQGHGHGWAQSVLHCGMPRLHPDFQVPDLPSHSGRLPGSQSL